MHHRGCPSATPSLDFRALSLARREQAALPWGNFQLSSTCKQLVPSSQTASWPLARLSGECRRLGRRNEAAASVEREPAPASRLEWSAWSSPLTSRRSRGRGQDLLGATQRQTSWALLARVSGVLLLSKLAAANVGSIVMNAFQRLQNDAPPQCEGLPAEGQVGSCWPPCSMSEPFGLLEETAPCIGPALCSLVSLNAVNPVASSSPFSILQHIDHPALNPTPCVANALPRRSPETLIPVLLFRAELGDGRHTIRQVVQVSGTLLPECLFGGMLSGALLSQIQALLEEDRRSAMDPARIIEQLLARIGYLGERMVVVSMDAPASISA